MVLAVFGMELSAQTVPIVGYNTNANGQVQLTINSSQGHYYILRAKNNPDGEFDLPTSMTLSQGGTTVLTESLAAYPLSHYEVLEHDQLAPDDTDGDGVDDMTEYAAMPDMSPLNAAEPTAIADGLVGIDALSTFNALSVTHNLVQWSEFLNGKKFVKYLITDLNANPKVYFINSETHNLHSDFANALDLEFLGDEIAKGQVIYHPTSISSNGTLGTFAFNFSNGHGEDFEVVERTHELLAANMPFLQNNLSYFITANNTDEYNNDLALYENSRIPVLFESDIYAEIDYWGLNQGEGYGLLRHILTEEIPGPRDIVIYESLPNSVPRVAGIVSGTIQTPLSHVNLRAIQDRIPNAFIRDPLSNENIASLLDHYVYYHVEQNQYTIREATLEEVNAWFDQIRPSEIQLPPLNLDFQAVLPLTDIAFKMADAFGAKCANVAVMGTFGFPEGTVPEGYGIPFYFYQEFMKHNQLFELAAEMLNDTEFQADREARNFQLAFFRAVIKQAEMPAWMMDALHEMHAAFPGGTSVRCRSSSNNEDLPGFSGAGLYDSKTHHPDEGHISKTVKQVYASLWNLRAFEERDFNRVDHFKASMGVLCHPNFSGETVNGVAVSIDPIYNTESTFYLNSQLGEDLITNPNSTSIPEEILVDWSDAQDDYTVIQRSNLIASDTLLMSAPYLNQMKDFLGVIQNEFERLYGAEGNPTFAVDIEYKITSEGQLAIKQARPWVFYVPYEPIEFADGAPNKLIVFPNPATEWARIQCKDCDLSKIGIFDIAGRLLREIRVDFDLSPNPQINVSFLPAGVYVLSAIGSGRSARHSVKFIKQ